jgi:dCMP deaminase
MSAVGEGVDVIGNTVSGRPATSMLPRIVMDFDTYNMTLARAAALKSKDRSTQVGCVIVGPDNEVRSTGYNGFPRNIDDDVEDRHVRPEKYFWTEHAERNAVYNAARHGTPLEGCTAFVTWTPCMDCARAIVPSGLIRVVGYEMRLDDPKWAEDFKRVRTLFAEADVCFEIIPTFPNITL